MRAPYLGPAVVKVPVRPAARVMITGVAAVPQRLDSATLGVDSPLVVRPSACTIASLTRGTFLKFLWLSLQYGGSNPAAVGRTATHGFQSVLWWSGQCATSRKQLRSCSGPGPPRVCFPSSGQSAYPEQPGAFSAGQAGQA